MASTVLTSKHRVVRIRLQLQVIGLNQNLMLALVKDHRYAVTLHIDYLTSLTTVFTFSDTN